jgi:hypothetical protein
MSPTPGHETKKFSLEKPIFDASLVELFASKGLFPMISPIGSSASSETVNQAPQPAQEPARGPPPWMPETPYGVNQKPIASRAQQPPGYPVANNPPISPVQQVGLSGQQMPQANLANQPMMFPMQNQPVWQQPASAQQAKPTRQRSPSGRPRGSAASSGAATAVATPVAMPRPPQPFDIREPAQAHHSDSFMGFDEYEPVDSQFGYPQRMFADEDTFTSGQSIFSESPPGRQISIFDETTRELFAKVPGRLEDLALAPPLPQAPPPAPSQQMMSAPAKPKRTRKATANFPTEPPGAQANSSMMPFGFGYGYGNFPPYGFNQPGQHAPVYPYYQPQSDSSTYQGFPPHKAAAEPARSVLTEEKKTPVAAPQAVKRDSEEEMVEKRQKRPKRRMEDQFEVIDEGPVSKGTRSRPKKPGKRALSFIYPEIPDKLVFQDIS